MFDRFNGSSAAAVLAALASTAVVAAAGPAGAQEQARAFDIPAQPLSSALMVYSRQSDIPVVAPMDLLRGKQAPNVRGTMTPDEALGRLLAGSGLHAERGANGGVILAHGESGPFVPAAAAAEPSPVVGEVVVTATRRATSVQKVSGGIVALSQETIKNTGAQNLSDIVSAAPGLSYSKNSPTEQVFTIRGVNTSSGVTNLQSPTALYMDEVPVADPYLNNLTSAFQLFDINRVEVLLGPQGTLFGAGALGGAVRVITNKPDLGQFGGAVEQTVGAPSEGGLSYTTNAMVNLPLVQDQLGLRLVGTYDNSGGYIDNLGLGKKDVNRTRVYAGRAELAWRPSDRLSLTGTWSYEDDRPDGAPYSAYGSGEYVYSSAVAARSRIKANIFNLLAQYAGDEVTATSSTSYLRRNPDIQADATDLISQITGLTTPAADVITGLTENFIQEFRLASPAERRLRWIGGVYLQRYRFDETETLTQEGAGAIFAPDGFPSDVILHDNYTGKVNEVALYGEAAYDLTDRLELTAGARAYHDSVELADYSDAILDGGPNLIRNSAAYSGVTPKFVLTYKPAAEVRLYVKADKGFRSGQGNLNNGMDPVAGTPMPTSYGPDHLWNYEAGIKSAWLGGSLVVNGDVYFIDWSQIQLQQHSPSGFSFTANAGAARIHGLDLQLITRPAEGVEVGGSLDYHQSRLTSVNPDVVARVGDRLPGSPNFSAYAYAKYSFKWPGELPGFVRLDYSWTGKAFSDLDNPTALTYGEVGSIGAQVGLSAGKCDFLLFARNLADSRGRISAFQLLGGPTEVLQPPRLVGMTVRANF